MRTLRMAFALALALTLWPGAAEAARYKVSFKAQGSFSRVNRPPSSHGRIDERVDFRVRFGFRPVSLFDGHRHTKRSAKLVASGSWSEAEENFQCSEQGTLATADFGLQPKPQWPSLAIRGRRAATVALAGGTAGPVTLGPQSTCSVHGGCKFGTPQEAGVCSIREVLRREDILKSPWFNARLRVSRASLRSHHGVFKVSNTDKAGEKVDPTCYFDAVEHPSCQYQWSGTVRFKRVR
jgi:hypothetical protein